MLTADLLGGAEEPAHPALHLASELKEKVVDQLSGLLGAAGEVLRNTPPDALVFGGVINMPIGRAKMSSGPRTPTSSRR
ncbi:hypothetical protein [Jannaschia sp. LMIT008]|uniref:hypothetical protein n=1 Tax=Jannaschia maritima TaxID=3032585 RepID=UPI00281117A5|nr:hypothetical protein [Jannaschia sp. LMIT008]